MEGHFSQDNMPPAQALEDSVVINLNSKSNKESCRKQLTVFLEQHTRILSSKVLGLTTVGASEGGGGGPLEEAVVTP